MSNSLSLYNRLTQAIQLKNINGVQTICAEINKLESAKKRELFTTPNDMGELLLHVAAGDFLQALPSMIQCIDDLDEAAQIQCLIVVQPGIYAAFAGELIPQTYNTLGRVIGNPQAPHQDNLFKMFDSLKENTKLALWKSPCYLFTQEEQKMPLALAAEVQPGLVNKCFGAIKKFPIHHQIEILQSARDTHPAIAREMRKTVDIGIKEFLSDSSELQKLIKNKMQSMKYWSDVKKEAILSAILELRDPVTNHLSDETIKAALKDEDSKLSRACNIKRFGGLFCQRHTGSYRAFLDEVNKPESPKKSS